MDRLIGTFSPWPYEETVAPMSPDILKSQHSVSLAVSVPIPALKCVSVALAMRQVGKGREKPSVLTVGCSDPAAFGDKGGRVGLDPWSFLMR